MNLSDQGLRRSDPTPVIRMLTATAAEVALVAALALAVLFTTAEHPFDAAVRFVAIALGLGTVAAALGAWATAKANGLWRELSLALKLAILCLAGFGLALLAIALAA